MPDIYPVDYTSEVGRVRKYIPDVRQLDGEYIFSDEEIGSFLLDELLIPENPYAGYQILRAAAFAMIAIANDENLILKKIKTEDLETDGPSVAKALLASAQELLKQADIKAGAEGGEFIVVPNPFFPSPGLHRGWVQF